MRAVVSGFSVATPDDLSAAIAMRREHQSSAFLAGGTDLLVNMRHGIRTPTLLIDLSEIDELARIEIDDAGVRIGASVTVATIASMPVLVERYRALAEAAETVAAPGHRAMGTVGGNLCLDTRCIYYNQSEWWRHANGYCLKHGGEVCHVAPQGEHCHAAFTGDLAPALLAFGAQVELAGVGGRRRIPLADLYVEDGRAHLALGPDEIVVAVHLPPAPAPSAYAKVRVRGAIDYPLAGVAVVLAYSMTVVKVLRIALTGTNSRPFVLAGTEAFLERPLDETMLQQVERLVQKQVQPMRTTAISANYRRLAAAALARRLMTQLGSREQRSPS
jgi:4-hydroxybenzoyl-CoA reductase subunit beta